VDFISLSYLPRQCYKTVFSQKTSNSFNIHILRILPHILKYISESTFFYASHFAYMTRITLCSHYVEITSSSPLKNVDFYSRVFVDVDVADTDSPSVVFVSM
jgi:hypothetical protein